MNALPMRRALPLLAACAALLSACNHDNRLAPRFYQDNGADSQEKAGAVTAPASTARPGAAAAAAAVFQPPDESDIPAGAFGDLVRRGRDLFLETDRLAFRSTSATACAAATATSTRGGSQTPRRCGGRGRVIPRFARRRRASAATPSAYRYVFPPLWGPDSFNWGAGMHQLDNAAAFIRVNMPLGRGDTLSEQAAWTLPCS